MINISYVLEDTNKLIDLPLTDLYDTEGTGGYPGFSFKARPVVGGHFAFLALERACEGNAVQALSFLDDDVPKASLRDEKVDL